MAVLEDCLPHGVGQWRGRGDHPGCQPGAGRGTPVKRCQHHQVIVGAVDLRPYCSWHMQRTHTDSSSPTVSPKPDIALCLRWIRIYPNQHVSSAILASQLPYWTMRMTCLLARSPSWNLVPATELPDYPTGTSPGTPGAFDLGEID